MDNALGVAGLDARREDERIATPIPTWSIETWLLALLGDQNVKETEKHKREFEKQYSGREERQALREAAEAWRIRAAQVPSVPSLADGKTEISRIESP